MVEVGVVALVDLGMAVRLELDIAAFQVEGFACTVARVVDVANIALLVVVDMPFWSASDDFERKVAVLC